MGWRCCTKTGCFLQRRGRGQLRRRLYDGIKDLPIVSPHGHTQAGWFARNEPFPDPVTLFVQPDHYVFRMLYSQGISLEELEIGSKPVKDRKVWRIFASDYRLFRGTPSRLWLDYAFEKLLECRSDCRRKQQTSITTRSKGSCARRNSCRARCLSDSGSKYWQQQIRRSIRWPITRRFANLDGRDGLCPRSGPIRWWIRASRDLSRMWLLWES